jgi:hypothetical protein
METEEEKGVGRWEYQATRKKECEEDREEEVCKRSFKVPFRIFYLQFALGKGKGWGDQLFSTIQYGDGCVIVAGGAGGGMATGTRSWIFFQSRLFF